MDFNKVIAVLGALDEYEVRYVLVGGVAVNLHGLGRTTQDLDLFLETDADNIRRLRQALATVFDDPSIDEICAEDLAGKYPTVRYVPPEEAFVIDLLGRLGEAFAFDDLESTDMQVEGVRVRVATPATLYRMKKDTLRPIDRMDAEALRRKFELEED